ncbi:MAG: MBL fold metallo-hydrolase, partial [Microscillaceae bacterium]|nr:MBL fold metallo-hydrolase [Microscillaceae bacterium]MDW8460282.1 MBL fold metallo-hydrolase [Cytophagales bacterium]
LGLLGLLSSMHLHRRQEPLLIFAPQGVAEMIRLMLKLSQTKLSYLIDFQPLEMHQSTQIYQDEHLTVETIVMHHSLPCVGFLFKEKPKKPKVLIEKLPENPPLEHILQLKNKQNVLDEQGNILYAWQDYTQPAPSHTFAHCADTQYFEDIIPQIQGADLIYHEATFLHQDLQKAQETYHSTALQAAQIAQKAQVKKLVIGHFSNRYKNLELFLQEARSVFPNTFLGLEGQEFTTE